MYKIVDNVIVLIGATCTPVTRTLLTNSLVVQKLFIVVLFSSN